MVREIGGFYVYYDGVYEVEKKLINYLNEMINEIFV